MTQTPMRTKTQMNSITAQTTTTEVGNMATMKQALRVVGLAAGMGVVASGMSGCGAGGILTGTPEPIIPVQGAAMQGRVQGGQQAVSGATIQLYAAGKTGYGSAATSLIGATVKSGADGGFSITGDYTCPAGSQVYLTATGGNPGLGSNNPDLAMMVALGPCTGTLSASQFIWVNEVTTVAAVYALAPFMTGVTNIGTSSTNALGLSEAFADANQLVDTSTGNSPGPALPNGATLHQDKIYTLANILAACINSTGDTSSTTPCGKLFTAATPSGRSAPTDTITAVMNVAQNPGQNVSSLYDMSPPFAPFQPSLSTQPNDWTLAVTYPVGTAPSSVAVDASGNAWVANKSGNSVSELAHSGTPVAVAYTNGVTAPTSVAVAADGSVYVANSTANTVAHLSSSGALVATLSGGGLSSPASVSIDPAGMIWVANSGANVLSEFNGTTPVSASGYTVTGASGTPIGVAISNY